MIQNHIKYLEQSLSEKKPRVKETYKRPGNIKVMQNLS